MSATTRPAGHYIHSLPWSLRHCNSDDAIDDAKNIAAFLCETVTSEQHDGFRPSDTALGDWKRGLRLCFMLLIDKLDIAGDEYAFPFSSHERSAPRLCRRNDAQGEEL